MKLEVGMYVRTNKGGIGKITFIQDKYVRTDSFIFYEDTLTIPNFFEEKIIKASHSLLGNDEKPCLIEVGDYVNGERVINIMKKHKYLEVSDEEIVIAEKDIKSIVTKEMFESISYKVGD